MSWPRASRKQLPIRMKHITRKELLMLRSSHSAFSSRSQDPEQVQPGANKLWWAIESEPKSRAQGTCPLKKAKRAQKEKVRENKTTSVYIKFHSRYFYKWLRNTGLILRKFMYENKIKSAISSVNKKTDILHKMQNNTWSSKIGLKIKYFESKTSFVGWADFF